MEIRSIWQNIRIVSRGFDSISILLFLATVITAAPASTGRAKGCNRKCQKECLDVLNKYRKNHDAPKLQFSTELASKAQKWADGGKFGYDMNAQGKYGQLIEWDVKNKLPSFTAAIKYWHDKEKDYDFVKQTSKNGRNLHDFTQVVWKKAHKAGCGRGTLFGSRYYVVWMDADGARIFNLKKRGSENVGAPRERDLHWFEITAMSAVGKPLYQNATNTTRSQNKSPKSFVFPEQEEERVDDNDDEENEELILNDSNNIKGYINSDSLSKLYDEENKEMFHLQDQLDGFGSPLGRLLDNQQTSDEVELPEHNNTENTIEKVQEGHEAKNNMEMKGYLKSNDTKVNSTKSRDDQGLVTWKQSLLEKALNSMSNSSEQSTTPASELSQNSTKIGHSLEVITPESAFSNFWTSSQRQHSKTQIKATKAKDNGSVMNGSSLVQQKKLNSTDSQGFKKTEHSLERINKQTAFSTFGAPSKKQTPMATAPSSKSFKSGTTHSAPFPTLLKELQASQDTKTRKPFFVKAAKIRHKSKLSKEKQNPSPQVEPSSTKQLQEMSGLILGQVSDNQQNSELDIFNKSISKDINSNIVSDDNLRPDMQLELSKVARLIDTKIKNLTKSKEPLSRSPNDKNYTKDKYNVAIKLDEKNNDDPNARHAKVWMPGASPNSTTNMIKNEHIDVQEIKNKVSELWKIHLKNTDKEKKQTKHPPQPVESDIYQDSGDDTEEESADKKEDEEDNDMVTVEDFNHLHGWQYNGFGQPLQSNTDNNGPFPFQNTRPAMEGGWYGMHEVPYDNNNDISQATNMQPGPYEFRKKYTGGEPEQGRVQKAQKIFEKKNSKSSSQGQDGIEHSKLEQLALESYKTPGRPLAYRNNRHSGMFIAKDYYKVLDLPKEIKLRKAKNTEKVSAQYLPEIMDDEETFQNKHMDENNDSQPGFFNEDFSHDHLTGSYEDDQNTVPSSSHKHQTPSHTKPASLLTSFPSSHKHADSSKETILQNKMDERFLSKPVKKISGQRPARQPTFQEPQKMANGVGHQMYEGSKAQVSGHRQRPMSNKDAEIGMMKISSFEKHQQQKLSRSVSMGDGSPVKNPYQTTSGVVITKGPFVYQTGTTMPMDGRKDDNSHSFTEGPGSNEYVQSVQQNVQHPSNQERDKDESKQHEQGRKIPFSLNRPSLITLLKENESKDRADEAKQREKGNELLNSQHEVSTTEGKSAKEDEKIFEKNTSESGIMVQSPSKGSMTLNVNPMNSSGTSSGLQGARKPKPLVPFSKLLSRINLALGIDSPDSKMKVDRQNSSSKTPQPPRDDEFRNPNLIVDEPELINDIQTLFKNHQSQDNNGFRRPHAPVEEPESKTFPKNTKHGQFWLNEGSPKEKLLNTNGSLMKTQTRPQKPLSTEPLGSKDNKNDSSTYVEQHTGQRMQPELSLKMHLNCADNEERCSSWQERGHCVDVKYAGFMKRNCKRSCGYCAFPGVQLQSEKASELNEASLKNDCQDLSTYEFSCPRWKAQGYCQRKEKSMRFACRRTCGFCKRKNTKKQRDSQSKVQTLPKTSTWSTYNDGNFAHAQTGAGKNVATAQTGNATNPQSTAYALGANTFVQTQSSSTQQSAYAVAYPAPSPQQQTYSHAQSSSKLGRQSNAYAQSGDEGKPANSKAQPKISASAQIGSAQQAYRGNDDSSTEPQKITDKEVTFEDRKVMESSPEYQPGNDSDGQYLVTTLDSEEGQQSYEVPEMRFPKGTKVSFLKRPKTGGENGGKPHQESLDQEGTEEVNPESLQESLAEAANEVIDDDVTPNPQDNVIAMTDSLDSQEANSLSNLAKKGSVNPVSTKGCNSTCQKECLEAINLYRKNHGSKPLKLSKTLAKHAQDWGDTKTYGHSPWARQGLGGELIAVGGFYKTFTAAVKAWHDEEKNIDWTTGKTKGVTRHFKQLVLKAAKFLGCGKTLINGEPYYIVQMDVAAAHDNTLKTTGKPKTPDLGWYSASSPYWKDLQGREAVPTRGQHRQPQNFLL